MYEFILVNNSNVSMLISVWSIGVFKVSFFVSADVAIKLKLVDTLNNNWDQINLHRQGHSVFEFIGTFSFV